LDDTDAVLLNVIVEDVRVFGDTSISGRFVREQFGRPSRVGKESDDVELPRRSETAFDEIL
jgi:hypothetical protein